MLPPPVASKPAYRAGQVTPKQRKPVRAPANFAIISPQVELLLRQRRLPRLVCAEHPGVANAAASAGTLPVEAADRPAVTDRELILWRKRRRAGLPQPAHLVAELLIREGKRQV